MSDTWVKAGTGEHLLVRREENGTGAVLAVLHPAQGGFDIHEKQNSKPFAWHKDLDGAKEMAEMRLNWGRQPGFAMLLEWKGKEALIRPLMDIDRWRLFMKDEKGDFVQVESSPNILTLMLMAESKIRAELRREARMANRVEIEGADW